MNTLSHDNAAAAPSAAFWTDLEHALGAQGFVRDAAIPEKYWTDWSGTPPVQPAALVRPRTTDEVSALMRVCHQHRVPVVPQGGLTGLAGAAVPTLGCVTVSLDRMNAIEDVNARTGLMTVQAGVTLQTVQEAAVAAGRVFGVDLGARGSCQIGGNVSTNAGGNGVLQNGMMREQVLGLEVVLADGTVLPMLRPMLKNNTLVLASFTSALSLLPVSRRCRRCISTTPITMAPPKPAQDFLDFVNASPTR